MRDWFRTYNHTKNNSSKNRKSDAHLLRLQTRVKVALCEFYKMSIVNNIHNYNLDRFNKANK